MRMAIRNRLNICSSSGVKRAFALRRGSVAHHGVLRMYEPLAAFYAQRHILFRGSIVECLDNGHKISFKEP